MIFQISQSNIFMEIKIVRLSRFLVRMIYFGLQSASDGALSKKAISHSLGHDKFLFHRVYFEGSY